MSAWCIIFIHHIVRVLVSIPYVTELTVYICRKCRLTDCPIQFVQVPGLSTTHEWNLQRQTRIGSGFSSCCCMPSSHARTAARYSRLHTITDHAAIVLNNINLPCTVHWPYLSVCYTPWCFLGIFFPFSASLTISRTMHGASKYCSTYTVHRQQPQAGVSGITIAFPFRSSKWPLNRLGLTA